MDAEGKESWRNQLIFFKKSFNLRWAVVETAVLKRSTGVELLFEKQIRTTGRLFCRCTERIGWVGCWLFVITCSLSRRVRL